MKTIAMDSLSPVERMAWLQSAVLPRPIAFASTINAAGKVNLSPFSFFNLFGVNPPVLIFSPARRVRDTTTKHTLQNSIEIPEVVVHIGSYAIVEQLSLASTEYAAGVNEFVKAGLTPVPSQLVKPPRVQEAPVAFECRVLEIKPIGSLGGAANLVICEILLMHVNEAVLDETGITIDPFKLDAVARLGGDWYSRVTTENIFKLPKPNAQLGLGFDQLPAFIKNSTSLTPNELGRLANLHQLPDTAAIQRIAQEPLVQYIWQKYSTAKRERHRQIEKLAKNILGTGNAAKSFALLHLLLEN